MTNKFKIIFVILVALFVSGCSLSKSDINNKINVSYDKYIKVNKVLPHNSSSFTEGLFFYNNKLYESSGLYGKSALYLDINLKDGISKETIKIADDIFAEGSTILNDKMYVLTYNENKVLVYDLNTKQLIETYNYPKEGWGLTTDGKNLIASDGTSKIYFFDDKLNNIKTLNTTLHGKPVNNINELEYIDNYIWANVWQTNNIIIIDPNNGKVIRKIDFTNLINKYLKEYPNIDSFNGIAYNNGKLYLTGKYYPYLFECKINNKIYN